MIVVTVAIAAVVVYPIGLVAASVTVIKSVFILVLPMSGFSVILFVALGIVHAMLPAVFISGVVTAPLVASSVTVAVVIAVLNVGVVVAVMIAVPVLGVR